MTRTAAVFAVLVAMLAPHAARADGRDERCEELRRRLGREHDRAVRWSYGWGVGLGALAVGQAVAAPLVSDRVQRDTFYVGAANAAVGAVSSLLFPLRVAAPEASATCAELEQQLVAAGDTERGAFYLDHVGGLVLNVGAAAVLWHYTDAKTAAVSFVVGYAIALSRTYTMPRWAWHPTFTVAQTGGAGIAIIGAF